MTFPVMPVGSVSVFPATVITPTGARHCPSSVDGLGLAATAGNAGRSLSSALAWFAHPQPGTADHLARAQSAVGKAFRYRARRRRDPAGKAVLFDCLNDSAVLLAQSPVLADRRHAARRFRRIAEFRWHAKDRHGWAVAQRNLGNTWATLADADAGEPRRRQENLARSIRAYEAALTVHTRRPRSVDYALVAYSLSNSLLADALLEGVPAKRRARFKEAIAALDEKAGGALAVLTRAEHPVDWANANWNLAEVYRHRSAPRAADLRRAIHHHGSALTVLTRDVSATEHALTLLPLAAAKESLAAVPGQPAAQLLREGIAHVNAVRQIYPADTAHRRTLERLRKSYLAVRGPADPAYANIAGGIV